MRWPVQHGLTSKETVLVAAREAWKDLADNILNAVSYTTITSAARIGRGDLTQ